MTAGQGFRGPRFFEYELPPERIAQQPAGYYAARSDARLLHFHAPTGALGDSAVRDLPRLLRPGDLLVLNDSRVVPCRFFVRVGDAAEGELFLLRRLGRERADAERWECLARPMKRFREGARVALTERITAEVIGRSENGDRLEVLITSADGALERFIPGGSMPIPPYIRGGRAEASDAELYQTVVAANDGSIAAPTAGLHFTRELLSELQRMGISHLTVTLHVGAASIHPVADPLGAAGTGNGSAPTERFSVNLEAHRMLLEARRQGRRIVAVGTTVVRALESIPLMGSRFSAGDEHETDLFVTPGFEFRMVDVLMTNFHQPRTTHLLLVGAFIGEAELERIYRHALAEGYRFLSYGDSMLLERV